MKAYIAENISERLQRVIPHSGTSVPLHEPQFASKEWTYVKDCLDTGWVSTVGEYVDRLEQAIVEYTGCKYAIAMVNGTSALHACLLALNLGRGDEVLTPSLTFVATANAISYTGATPHFVDINTSTLAVDAERLADYLEKNTYFASDQHSGETRCVNRITQRAIRCLVVVHTFGHPADVDALHRVCSQYHIHLVEDAAESLGSFYYKTHTGSRSLLASLSFNGNKIITTGGGGAVICNDDKLASYIRHISTTAKRKDSWRFEHDAIAYNYRMPNINAALGLAQMEQIHDFVEKKRCLAQRYQDAFEDYEAATVFHEAEYAQSNYWLNVLVLNSEHRDSLRCVLSHLQEQGYQVRPAWRLMHELPMYQDNPRMDLCQSEDLAGRIICLPSGVALV